MKNEHKGIKRIVSAARFSLAGLTATFKSEEALYRRLPIGILPIDGDLASTDDRRVAQHRN